MAAYAQFGYSSYPSASQMLSSNTSQSPQGVPDTPASVNAHGTAPTLSPGECRNSAIAGDVSSDALSPDALSQNSNAAQPSGVPTNAVAAASDASTGAVPIIHLPSSVSTGSACCENGRPIITDPVSGQNVCSCQYDSARLALSSYSRLPAASVGVYGTPYPSTDQNPYQSIGVDSSAFYSPLSNPYALKDTAAGSEMTAWTSASLQPTTGYYSYDPMSAYGYGASYDLAARRKNATRESTATLKAWLNEHKKNPYPTKGEKIMLAIITKMTLTQVSTWFANARRRLKKENKMTWEPKNRTDDDDDAIVSEDEKDKDDMDSSGNKIIGGQESSLSNVQNKSVDDMSEEDRKPLVGQVQDLRATSMGFSGAIYHGGNRHGYHPYQMHAHHAHHQSLMSSTGYAGNNGSGDKLENNNNNNNNNSTDSKNLLSRDCGVPVPATKPKIWSLADTVACKTPPPTVAYLGQQHQHQQQQQHHLQQQQQQHMELQQHQQHQHQQQPIQHMMSNYGGASFTRAPITAYENFQGAPTTQQHRHTTNSIPYHNNNNNTNTNNINHSRSNNNNNNINTTSSNNNNPQYNNNNSNNNNNMPISIMPITTATTTTTTTINHHIQQQQQHNAEQQQQHQQQQQLIPAHMRMVQQQQQQQHQQQGVNQRGMGFPEAQPDTPPQTPPNMKLPANGLHTSVATSGLTSAASIQAVNQIYTVTPLHTIATCHNNNNNNNNSMNYADSSSTHLAINFGVRFVNDYSPRDDNSSSCSNNSGRSSANDANAIESPTQSHNITRAKDAEITTTTATTAAAFKTLLKSPQHNPLGGFVTALQ